MPMSPYVRALRARVGTTRLLLPSASAHIFDSSRRLLLVRQREEDLWSTPGGLIEPDERPADAVVRETWEETGLLVTPRRLLGIYGGPEFVVRYGNGDEVQYVIAWFGCEVIGGTLRNESEETVDAKYFTQSDAARLRLSDWLGRNLAAVYAQDEPFVASTWRPSQG